MFSEQELEDVLMRPCNLKSKTEIRVTMVHSYAALRRLKEHTTARNHSYARLKSEIRKGKILAFFTIKLFLRFLVCQKYRLSRIKKDILILLFVFQNHPWVG